MIVSFYKYHGSGNDFILIDDRKKILPKEESLIQNLCDRHCMIGADGIILLQNSSRADYRMIIYNADGKEAAFCGNAFLSLLHFLYHHVEKKEFWLIETKSGTILGKKQEKFSFTFPNVQWIGKYHMGKYDIYRADVGVSHACIFVDDVKNMDVEKEGKKIRWHTYFQPQGVNVNFIQEKDQELHVRTFEKGVEKETLACGSGAIASALSCYQIKNLQNPIKVHFIKGTFEISLFFDKDNIQASLQGSAEKSFEGSIML